MNPDDEHQTPPSHSQFEEVDPEDFDAPEIEAEEDELSPEFVSQLIDRMMDFGKLLVKHDLHEYQKPFARRVMESVIVGDGEELTALASRQSGKALDVDTPMLTANRGWTTMGDLVTGDFVYAPDGTPTEVLMAHPVFTTDAYEVTLTDGRSVVASGNHLWGVFDHNHAMRYDVLNTTQLLEAGISTPKSSGRTEFRFRMPNQLAVRSPDVDLPLDPYWLGYWLGDGHSYSPMITCHRDDVEHLLSHTPHNMEVWDVEYSAVNSNVATVKYRGIGYSLPTLLHDMGLLRRKSGDVEHKHIPVDYLAAGTQQRIALMQGLMDSDGHAGRASSTGATRAEFVSVKESLSRDVLTLALSLGLRATLIEGDAKLKGAYVSPKYRVCWTAYAEDPAVFSLPRKAEAVVFGQKKTRSSIRSIEKVSDRETRCITVASEDALFLAGDQLIPTHNTEIISFVVATLMILLPRLAQLYPDLLGKFKDGIWIGMFAPVESQAETLFGRTVNRLTSDRALEILSDPEIDDIAKKTGGATKGLRLVKSGSTLTMMTANPKANIESKSFHLIIIDEAQATDDFVVSKSIAPMAAYYNGTIVKTGTPTVVKNHYYRAIQQNKRRATQRGGKTNHFQWDWRTVAKYNANYEKFIRKEMLRIGEDSDEFRLSYCVAPETRILTEDLRHVKADDIAIGDRLVGFDEYRPEKGQHRRLKPTVVEGVRDIWLPSYRLTLSDGTSVTCSGDHRWLVSTPGRRTVWKTTEDLGPKDRIFKITEVWDHTEDYRTGYVAGVFDGEGNLNQSKNHCFVSYAQRTNATFRKTQRFLSELGFQSTVYTSISGTNKDVNVIGINGGRAEVMRFLGQARPERLLDDLDVTKLGSIGRHDRKSGGFEHPTVVSKEFIGEQHLISITTNEHTFVAEGLASHNCGEWLLEQGMFVSEAVVEDLGDKGQQVVKNWHRTPVVVGIDPARKTDSTVVTVVWVDWDRPDEFGYYDHQVLNWLDLSGQDWEEQYFQITNFLANYNVLAIAVDANGVGDAVAQRLKVLMPRAEIVPVSSSPSEQSARYKHLQALIQRKMIGWPAHAFTRRLRTYKRFVQQMTEAELVWKGPSMLVAAPNEAHAHDDYVDSLSLACSLTKDQVQPQVEVSSNVFFH